MSSTLWISAGTRSRILPAMQAEIMALLAQLDLRDDGPDLIPDSGLETDPTPYLILFGLGFLLGAPGHLPQPNAGGAGVVPLVSHPRLIRPLVYALAN